MPDTATATRPPRTELGKDAAGLVIMLDAAGRTIAGLEARVEQLTDALVAEQRQRQELERLLAAARATAEHPDTGDVDPSRPDTTDTRHHDRDPARSST